MLSHLCPIVEISAPIWPPIHYLFGSAGGGWGLLGRLSGLCFALFRGSVLMTGSGWTGFTGTIPAGGGCVDGAGFGLAGETGASPAAGGVSWTAVTGSIDDAGFGAIVRTTSSNSLVWALTLASMDSLARSMARTVGTVTVKWKTKPMIRPFSASPPRRLKAINKGLTQGLEKADRS